MGAHAVIFGGGLAALLLGMAAGWVIGFVRSVISDAASFGD
jgi:hypothetical protein